MLSRFAARVLLAKRFSCSSATGAALPQPHPDLLEARITRYNEVLLTITSSTRRASA
jgi:hypothetical protein